jgi:membrane-bound serine protease (ClpP class)
VVVEILVVVVAGILVFEVFEHVIVPLVARRAQGRLAAMTGPEALIGRSGEVRRWSGKRGAVFVNGELWDAESDAPLAPGDHVTILDVRNLSLRVAADRQPTDEDPQSLSVVV